MKKLKKKKKVKYEQMRCTYIKSNGKRCKRNAVGEETLCERHGGIAIIRDNQLPTKLKKTKGVKYNPKKHLITTLQLAKLGKSLSEIAAAFNVSVVTLRNWADRYTDFYEILEVAKTIQEAHWTQTGRNNLNNTRFQTSLYKYLTGNLLGWSDKIESKSFNTNVHGVLLVPKQMNEEEWEAACEQELQQIEQPK